MTAAPFTPEETAKLAAFDAAPTLAESSPIVRAVLGIHRPMHGYCAMCDRDRDVEALGNDPACPHYASYCHEDDFAWPCRTVRAVATVLAADPEPRREVVAVCPECDSSTGHWHGCGYGLPDGYRKDAAAALDASRGGTQ